MMIAQVDAFLISNGVKVWLIREGKSSGERPQGKSENRKLKNLETVAAQRVSAHGGIAQLGERLNGIQESCKQKSSPKMRKF